MSRDGTEKRLFSKIRLDTLKKCLHWYGRTVTVPEVAGRPGGAGREQETRTRTERRRCTAGRWPRAPGDQPDGRRHGRRAYPTAGQEHGTAPPHPGGARVGAAGAPARRLCTPCPGQRARHHRLLTGGRPGPVTETQLLQPHVRARACTRPAGLRWRALAAACRLQQSYRTAAFASTMQYCTAVR